MTIWRKWIKEINETLLDLILGCLIYSALFELIGLAVVSDKVSWSAGICLGTAAAAGLCISMYKGLADCLSMNPAAARRTMTMQSIIRLFVMFAVAWLGIRIRQISFPAVIVGMLGLKVSAHMHMYTNVYITKRLKKKGR
ncbi:MAG: hypothetical protein IJI25_06015 [Eubacterium sp.]|nr:hypothetical protein [Eubacterium sp.]